MIDDNGLKRAREVRAIARRFKEKSDRVVSTGDSYRSSQDNDVSYLVAFNDTKNDLTALLVHLPSLAEDCLLHSEAIAQLVKLVALQQRQIQDLRCRLEAIVNGEIGVKVQENMHDLIRGLAELGSDVEEPEVRATMTGRLKSQTLGMSNARSHTEGTTSTATRVRGAMKGLLKLLAEMNFTVDLNNAGTAHEVRELDEVSSLEVDESRTAEIVLRFKSIKGSPIAHARAATIRSATEGTSTRADLSGGERSASTDPKAGTTSKRRRRKHRP